MKRDDLLRRLREAGCIFVRHGGRHDWYEQLARHILRQLAR